MKVSVPPVVMAAGSAESTHWETASLMLATTIGSGSGVYLTGSHNPNVTISDIKIIAMRVKSLDVESR